MDGERLTCAPDPWDPVFGVSWESYHQGNTTPEPIARFLAYPGMNTLFCDREKCGKTTKIGQAVAAVLNGTDLWGRPTKQGRVLYYHEESRSTLGRRFELFGASPQDFASIPLVELARAQSDPAVVIAEQITRYEPTLCVIDTLTTLADVSGAGARGMAETWGPIMAPIIGATHVTSCGTLVSHHTTKDAREYRDSTAIAGACDLVIVPSFRKSGFTQKFKAMGRMVGEDFAVRGFDSTTQLTRLEPLDGFETDTPADGLESDLDEQVSAHLREHATQDGRGKWKLPTMTATRSAISARAQVVDASYRRVGSRVRRELNEHDDA